MYTRLTEKKSNHYEVGKLFFIILYVIASKPNASMTLDPVLFVI